MYEDTLIVAEVDPQEFGEVKANVTNIVTTLSRIEPKLDGLVTKETFKASIDPITIQLNDVDTRLRKVEDRIKLEQASVWTSIKLAIQNNIVMIVALALTIGLLGVVATYFLNSYQPREVIEAKEK